MADQLTGASYYFSTPAETTLSAATPALAAGTTTELQSNNMTVSATNRITLDAGQTTRVYDVCIAVSMTKASGGAAVGGIRLAKNGTVVTGASVDRTLANTADEGAIALTAQVSLAASDYIEVFVESDNGDNITVQSGGMSCRVAW